MMASRKVEKEMTKNLGEKCNVMSGLLVPECRLRLAVGHVILTEHFAI